MIWGKRRFAWAEYAPYSDLLQSLMMAAPALCQQFIMVSAQTENAGVSDYYVGVPNESFMAGFDGFERVAESDLPKEIDNVDLAADQGGEEFTSRFQLRKRW